MNITAKQLRLYAVTDRHWLNGQRLEDVVEELLAAGVTDPVKVTRSALQNAASIAGLFLTTEAVVANKPEPKSAAPAAGADMGY